MNKIQKKAILLFFTVLFFSPLLIRGAETNALEFPDIKLTITGDYDIVVDTRNLKALSALFDPFKTVPKGCEGIHSIKHLTGDKYRVSATTMVGLTDTPSDQMISVIPAVTTGDKAVWLMKLFLDFGTELYENLTDTTDTWEYATNFNSLSYQYITFADVRSKSSSNTTIIFTYADSLTANISDSADVTNTTIYNNHLASEQNMWFRTDLHTTNSSRPYILHIAVDEMMSEAKWIFSLPSEQDFRDARYYDIYLGSTDTPVNTTDHTYEYNEILDQPIDYTEKYLENDVLGVGYETESDFEKALLEAFATAYGIDFADIDNYNITEALVDVLLSSQLSSHIYDEFDNEKDKSGVLNTYLAETKEKTIRTVTFTTEMSPKTLKESSNGEDVTDLSNGAIASSLKSRGKSTSFSANIFDKVCSLATSRNKITKALGIFATKARETAHAYGLSDNWILAIIILGAISGLIVVTLVIRFAYIKWG